MLAYAPVPVFRTCELGNKLEQSKATSLMIKWQGTVGSGLGSYHLCSQAIFQTDNLTKIDLLVTLEKHIQNIHFFKSLYYVEYDGKSYYFMPKVAKRNADNKNSRKQK